MSIFSSNQFATWVSKQTTKGVPASAASARKQLRVVSGGLSVSKEFGSEAYGDGTRVSSAADYIQTLQGGGELTVQANAGVAGYLCYLMLGTDSFTAADEDSSAVHTITPAETGSLWSTWWYTVGEGADSIRQQYADAKISQLVIEASSGTPTLHVNPTIVSIDPGKTVAANAMPSTPLADIEPLLFTEMQGTFTVDGTAYGEVSQFAITINDDLNPVYGDDVTAYDMAAGRSTVEITYTVAATSDTLPAWNTLVYGTPNPVAGTSPSKAVYYGEISLALTRGSGENEERFSVTIPKVAFTAAPAIEGQPDGGVIELAMTGSARPNGTDPVITVEVTSTDASDDAAF